MDIFFVKLQSRRDGEDYIQVTPFIAEDKAIEKFQQVLDVARMFDVFTESTNLSDSLIRHASSKFASVKLYRIKEGESKLLRSCL